jgi:hypothetical protein
VVQVDRLGHTFMIRPLRGRRKQAEIRVQADIADGNYGRLRFAARRASSQ